MTKTFVSHLECSYTGKVYPADQLHGLSEAGKPLLVKYDLDALGKAISKDDLKSRLPEFWRYREFLPLRKSANVVRLGEVMTPILAAPKLQVRYGCGEILIKDEGRLPTGSFKARGIALAVAMAKELGITTMAMPTNGNAGAALAAYCSAADIETYVFCPEDTPRVNIEEIAFQGAKTFLVNGYITDCGRIVGEGKQAMGWFDASTLKEPYRIEGKKTMGLELAEQYGWQLPDVIFFPTGGGVCLIAMWKVFNELKDIGWLKGPLPRMAAVQSTGCGPIVRAFEAGEREVTEPWENVTTQIHGVRVPNPIGGRLVLDVLYESNGFGPAVDDDAVTEARARICAEEGFHMCPEGAACVVALEMERASGRIKADDRVVLFNTASGLKSPMPPLENRLEPGQAVDYSVL